MRDLSRPFASTANIPVKGGVPGFVVVTRSVRTTSGQASLTRSARRSSAAGSWAAADKERKIMLPRKTKGSPLPLPRILL